MPLTIGIGDPRRGIQNPGLSWIPLHGATGDALSPDIWRNWNSLITIIFLIYLGSVISNEDGF